MTDEQLASIRTFWHNLEEQTAKSHVHYGVVETARNDTDALLAEVERLQKIIDDIQDYTVRHFFDMRAGREIDDYITRRLKGIGDGNV